MLFLCSDVKGLAEKEDWMVDNEGITSLVRKRRSKQDVVGCAEMGHAPFFGSSGKRIVDVAAFSRRNFENWSKRNDFGLNEA